MDTNYLNLGPREQTHTNLISLLRTLRGTGVENLLYVTFPCSKIRMYSIQLRGTEKVIN